MIPYPFITENLYRYKVVASIALEPYHTMKTTGDSSGKTNVRSFWDLRKWIYKVPDKREIYQNSHMTINENKIVIFDSDKW